MAGGRRCWPLALSGGWCALLAAGGRTAAPFSSGVVSSSSVPPATSASALAERYSPAPMDRPSASTVEIPMTSVSAGEDPPDPATAARSANVVRMPSIPPNTMPRMWLWNGFIESAGFEASSAGDAHSF